MFMWLALLVVIFLFVQSTIIWCILERRYKHLTRYRILNNNDDDEADNERIFKNSDNYRLNSLKADNGGTHFDTENHEEIDNDSQNEFEQ